MPRLVLGHQHFVHLLSGPDPDALDPRTGRNRPGQTDPPHAGDLRDEPPPAEHPLDTADGKPHPLIAGQPEACHALIGDRDGAAGPLAEEYRDDAGPAAHADAISHATET